MILIAAIAASPFGIFFASEPEPDAVPLNVAISQINMEYSARLAELQEGDYDSIQLHGNPPIGRRWRRYSQAIRQEPRTVWMWPP